MKQNRRGVRKHFDERIILGKDLMEIWRAGMGGRISVLSVTSV